MHIDTIIENARILTHDARRPRAHRIGVLGQRIVGLDEELHGVRATRRLNARGATIMPGFNDAHAHTVWFGQTLAELDLSRAATPDEIYGLVSARASEGDGWLVASGFNPLGLSGALDRDALDRAAGGRPVWIKHTSGHAYTLNGIGLTRLGIGESAGPQIDGGRVVTNAEDRPTGLLEENAMRLVQDVLQPDSEAAVRDALARATRHYATEGITSVTDAGIAGGWIGHTPREFACYQSARDAGLLRTRLQAMITVDALHVLAGHGEDPPAVGLDAGIRSGVGDEWLQIGPTKIFTDGSLLGATAAMTQEYCRSHGNVGYFQGDTGAMRSQALLAAAAGWSLALHAIGDRAVDFALDTIEQARVTCGAPRLPHRIEHGGVVRPDQVTRMARLGVALVPQPLFIAKYGDGMAAKLGPDRTLLSYPAASVLRAGGVLAGSSDRPVAPGAPLPIVQAFVQRLTESGAPYAPDERLSVAQALHAFTVGSAIATGWADDKGTLSTGMLADLAVLADDPHEVPVERIGAIEVVATVVGGTFVHGGFDE